MEGDMAETYFHEDQETNEVTEGSTQIYSKGEVGYICDDTALHKVFPVGGKGCTMHIYSKPIPICNIYCPLTGKITRRKLGFYTIKGMKQCSSQYNKCYIELKKRINCGRTSCPKDYAKLFSSLEESL